MYMNGNLFEPGKSKTERNFIQNIVKQNIRFDGRKSNEFRDVTLNFGADWGTVVVTMGDTKVLGHVSCDIGTPSTSRPNEGTLHLNVDIKGVAFLDEVPATYDQRFLTLNSLLEKTFRSSRCIDLESLCIAVEHHVWCVRLDITVLNHDGNLYDASTIAALASLMHFRRPEVSYVDNKVRTFSERERELLPLLFLHYPVSVTYCIYKSSPQPLVDPTLLEENAADSILVLSFNSYEELCTLNAGGTAPTNVHTIMQCARSAANRSKNLVKFIRKALEYDAERRLQPNGVAGLVELLYEKAPKLSFKNLMLDNLSTAKGVKKTAEKAVQLKKHETVNEDYEMSPQISETSVDESTWLPCDQDILKKGKDTTVTKTVATQRGKTKHAKKQQAISTKADNSDSEEEIKTIM